MLALPFAGDYQSLSLTPVFTMLTLKKTCSACPEQYDAFLDGKRVGYLQLRYGGFYAQVPGCGEGPIVYTANPRGDGEFYDEEERDFHLRHACQAILNHLAGISPTMPALNYIIENQP